MGAKSEHNEHWLMTPIGAMSQPANVRTLGWRGRAPLPLLAPGRRAASRDSPAAVAQSSRWRRAVPAIISPRSWPPADHARVRRQLSAHLMIDQPVRDGRLTRAELVDQVAEAADLTKNDAEVVLETVLSNIVEALRRGEKVELRGFGSFRLRHRDARRGRNPKTGGRVDVPPKLVPYFRPGKELKALINQEQTEVLLPPLSE